MASERLVWWSGSALVIALVAVVLAYRASDALRDDRAFFTRTDLVAIGEQLRLYKERHGSYPSSLAVLVTEKQFHELPRDPWHHNYVYRFPSARDANTFDLFSLGRDGVEDADDVWLPR
jgi:hypothetical protein